MAEDSAVRVKDRRASLRRWAGWACYGLAGAIKLLFVALVVYRVFWQEGDAEGEGPLVFVTVAAVATAFVAAGYLLTRTQSRSPESR